MGSKYFFALILILFSVFWIWWLPGPRVANDFSFISPDWLKLQFDIPRVWNERGAEGLGEYGVFILWSYPISFIFGALANFGLTFEIWERILVLIFIFLGSISIWKFLSPYQLSNKSKLVGSLFYLVNTYSMLLIDGGQISIALAFALFPLAFLFFISSVNSPLRKKILTGIVVTILGFFDIRFIYVLFLLILIKALVEKNFLSWIRTGVIIGAVVIGLNSFWLVTQFKVPIENEIRNSFTKISTNFVNIGHALFVISPHWYTNIFGKISQLRWEFGLLPVLVFLAPILKRKDKNVSFWLVVALVSIFLTKGGTEPLSNIYLFLHSNIPGFSFFRDSTKFFFLLILSFSVLFSITSEELMNRSIFLKKFYPILIVIYILFLVRPVYLNQMTGTFSKQANEKEFQSLATLLGNDKNFGRVFWIPQTSPLAYSDLNHPIVEASRVFNRIPFSFGVKGRYEVFNFLREAPYMDEIFDISAISYISYPYPDFKRSNLSAEDIKYYYTFLGQLSNLGWIEGSIPQSKVLLLKVRNHQDKFFIAPNSWFVFGTDEVFRETSKNTEIRLSKNAIIFAEQKIGSGYLAEEYPEIKIVLNKKTVLDLIASFIPASEIIFPSKTLSQTPGRDGWWKNDGADLISWRDFLQTKYGIDNKEFDLGGGWAVGEGNLEFRIKNSELRKDKLLLARVLESTRGGSLRFYQNDQLIGQISTVSERDASVRWFEIGILQKRDNLVVKTEGDINLINALAVVVQQDLASYKDRAKKLEGQIADFRSENVLSTSPNVRYEKINQTKYKVVVSNLSSPAVIVFSTTYHPGWKLNKKSSIPVYGFLNGFRVEQDGEYTIEFEPQSYILPGLLISGLALLIILILI